jgi:hypothetical protein
VDNAERDALVVEECSDEDWDLEENFQSLTQRKS